MSPRYFHGVVVFAALVTLGCEAPQSNAPPEPESVPSPQPAAAAPPAAQPEMVREQATVGVGKRGGDIPAQPSAVDIITTPTNVYFRAQEQVIFNIQIPQAMDLYKASEGHAPKTEEEFFDKIVKANHLQLPDLPAGHKYVYDPEKEQLMVEHPKQ